MPPIHDEIPAPRGHRSPPEQYCALQERRQQEGTAEYAREYAHRAGIAETISQGVRALEMRGSRSSARARPHLGHVLTAVAINPLR
ncbi:MAG: transposase [Ktedonobacterales bacterium]|nr:transposase [Ktedonobacterales bacterium]